MEDNVIEIRKDKVVNFFKKNQLWVIAILVIAIILGMYIRSLPMMDHNGKPGLWDVAKNDWTLGPDLDPWLFLRYAKLIIANGKLPRIDSMRNVPLGFDTTIETQLHPYMIAYTYYIVSLFHKASVEYSADLFAVIMFGFTIITFFLFVREIFVRKGDKSKFKANVISLISTFFMVVIPVLLPRTIAGIPEKEANGFVWIFLALYLFLKAWKAEKDINAYILAALAGITTAVMGLIWGGVIYIYVTLALAALIAFLLNKVKKREFYMYTLWTVLSIGLMAVLSNRETLKGLLTSISSGLAFLVFFILLVDFVLSNTRLSKMKVLNGKIPRNIVSLIVAGILLVVLTTLIFGPSFIIQKIEVVHQTTFHAIEGRWATTVAENKQPYFVEWSSSFGPFIRNVPVLFWLFFIGSVILFKKMLKPIKARDAWILTALYVFFFFGIVFSRYSASSVFNGDNFISILFYYSAVLLLFGALLYYYYSYHKHGHRDFEKIRFEYILLFSLFGLTLFTARGAIRLIMVLGPIAPIFVGSLIFESSSKFFRTKDETGKIVFGIIAIIIIALSIFAFYGFYKDISAQSYGYVPNAYNQQWQKSMKWVRENTNKDAVFAHWWDYGYWVQSIGERATVLDGGNAITYWNYLMGRYVLTGDNQKDALEFLYNHNATHLLIDSSDIGKYGAFSSIGSNENFDRFSYIGIMLLDNSQTKETQNQTLNFYTGSIGLDEDMMYNDNGKNILLPSGNAGVAAIVVPNTNSKDGTKFGQPYSIVVSQGKQYNIYLRYLFVNNQVVDFKNGIEGGAFLFPRVDQTAQGIQTAPIGAAMYISPRLLRGMMIQEYVLNDPFKKFPNFKLVNEQPAPVVEILNQQGAALPSFVYFNGLQGPIKIWEIKYTGSEKLRKDYIDKDYTKYLSWQL